MQVSGTSASISLLDVEDDLDNTFTRANIQLERLQALGDTSGDPEVDQVLSFLNGALDLLDLASFELGNGNASGAGDLIIAANETLDAIDPLVDALVQKYHDRAQAAITKSVILIIIIIGALVGLILTLVWFRKKRKEWFLSSRIDYTKLDKQEDARERVAPDTG